MVRIPKSPSRSLLWCLLANISTPPVEKGAEIIKCEDHGSISYDNEDKVSPSHIEEKRL